MKGFTADTVRLAATMLSLRASQSATCTDATTKVAVMVLGSERIVSIDPVLVMSGTMDGESECADEEVMTEMTLLGNKTMVI
jgi:hypothetical protein